MFFQLKFSFYFLFHEKGKTKKKKIYKAKQTMSIKFDKEKYKKAKQKYRNEKQSGNSTIIREPDVCDFLIKPSDENNEHFFQKVFVSLEELKNDGEPKNVTVIGYYKYAFTISFETDHFYSEIYVVVSDPDDVYKFSPYDGWEEWENKEITILKTCKL